MRECVPGDNGARRQTHPGKHEKKMVQVVPALPPLQSTESHRASGIAVWPLVLSSLCMVSVCGLLVIAGANSDATAVRAQLALDMQPHAHIVSSVSGLTRADHRYSHCSSSCCCCC